jgi:hypothetical protein
MIMYTLITNDGREETTSSQIQGLCPSTYPLWHHSHPIVHYTNPVPHMGAGWWRASKTSFLPPTWFFKTNEILKNMEKINTLYQEVKIIFNYKYTLFLPCK